MKGVLLVAFLILCIYLMPRACQDRKGAQKALEDQGYTNIEFTGYEFFSCGEDYTFHTGFKAVSIAKKPVQGVVCSGWFKGYGIKTE